MVSYTLLRHIHYLKMCILCDRNVLVCSSSFLKVLFLVSSVSANANQHQICVLLLCLCSFSSAHFNVSLCRVHFLKNESRIWFCILLIWRNLILRNSPMTFQQIQFPFDWYCRLSLSYKNVVRASSPREIDEINLIPDNYLRQLTRTIGSFSEHSLGKLSNCTVSLDTW